MSGRPAAAFLAATAFVLGLVFAGAAGAKERDGVTFEDRVAVEGKPLVLNGRLGLRVRKILLVSIKVYVMPGRSWPPIGSSASTSSCGVT